MSTAPALSETLTEYHTGLKAELRLLTRLKQLSDAQHEAGQTSEVTRLAEINAERDRVMNALMAIEERLKPLRQALAERRQEIVALPGYAETIALHRRAEALVVEIVDGDRQTVEALEKVESTRRLAHEMIEKGRASLSAYRRVVLPESIPAALFNRRS